MLILLIFIILLTFYNPALATLQKNIVSKMELINNLSFDFIQTIDDKNRKWKLHHRISKKNIL